MFKFCDFKNKNLVLISRRNNNKLAGNKFTPWQGV
jgi:hypothetical protein